MEIKQEAEDQDQDTTGKKRRRMNSDLVSLHCPWCFETHSSWSRLVRHVKKEHEKDEDEEVLEALKAQIGRARCNVCGKDVAMDYDSMASHLRHRHGRRMADVKMRPEEHFVRLDQEQLARQHGKQQEEEGDRAFMSQLKVTCQICQSLFPTVETLKKHLLKQHRTGASTEAIINKSMMRQGFFRCRICGKFVPKFYNRLCRHLLDHNRKILSYLREYSSSAIELTEEERKVAEETLLVCSLCGQEVVGLAGLNHHLREGHSMKRFSRHMNDAAQKAGFSHRAEEEEKEETAKHGQSSTGKSPKKTAGRRSAPSPSPKDPSSQQGEELAGPWTAKVKRRYLTRRPKAEEKLTGLPDSLSCPWCSKRLPRLAALYTHAKSYHKKARNHKLLVELARKVGHHICAICGLKCARDLFSVQHHLKLRHKGMELDQYVESYRVDLGSASHPDPMKEEKEEKEVSAKVRSGKKGKKRKANPLHFFLMPKCPWCPVRCDSLSRLRLHAQRKHGRVGNHRLLCAVGEGICTFKCVLCLSPIRAEDDSVKRHVRLFHRDLTFESYFQQNRFLVEAAARKRREEAGDQSSPTEVHLNDLVGEGRVRSEAPEKKEVGMCETGRKQQQQQQQQQNGEGSSGRTKILDAKEDWKSAVERSDSPIKPGRNPVVLSISVSGRRSTPVIPCTNGSKREGEKRTISNSKKTSSTSGSPPPPPPPPSALSPASGRRDSLSVSISSDGGVKEKEQWKKLPDMESFSLGVISIIKQEPEGEGEGKEEGENGVGSGNANTHKPKEVVKPQKKNEKEDEKKDLMETCDGCRYSCPICVQSGSGSGDGKEKEDDVVHFHSLSSVTGHVLSRHGGDFATLLNLNFRCRVEERSTRCALCGEEVVHDRVELGHHLWTRHGLPLETYVRLPTKK